MTELAYLTDMSSAYVRSFRARVVALPPGGVVLDRTFFYPTGGGQPADHGSLRTEGATLAVVDVIRSGSSVHHRLRGAPSDRRPLTVGSEVEGLLDWERRHRHMRLHTGQHLLSALAFERTGLRTRKAVLKDLGATIDLDAEMATSALDEIGREMDELIGHALAVTIRQIPRGEWETLPSAGRSGLVPLPPYVDPVRVIEIDGHDSCPCGGTHVRSTAEIGEVRLTGPAPDHAGGTRIGFTLTRPGATTPSE